MAIDDTARLSELERLRLGAIVESSDDAIVSKDLDGTIRTWNPAAERIFGYTAAEMVGNSIFRLIPPDLHDEERSLLARIATGEHIAHYETDRVRKDGRRIRVSLTLSPLRDSSNRLIGASAIKRDVTRQRSLELQLQQAQRMEAVGRLSGGIAHDFNNLLTIISGLTNFVLRRMPPDTQERTDLEQVVEAAERATALTQQLLTFSRRQIASTESLDLTSVVRGLEPLLRRLLGAHIVVRTSLAPDLGRTRGNRAQLEQVVMNLVLNARDAMPDGGTLTIRAEQVEISGAFSHERLRLTPGPHVVLSVSDTGIGMDALTMASIFEPFFTTKPPGQGTGLGLATVYAIAQQAGGAVYVYSEPGQGAVFKVYFPVTVGAAAETAPPTPAAAVPDDRPAPHATVLLVEDERGVRTFTARVLEEAGYRVLEASNAEEAFRLVAEWGNAVDLLMTDVVMPGMNGRLLAERLRESYPTLAVLFTSGYTDDMILRAGVVVDGGIFLQKPYTHQSLLDKVRAAITAAASPGTG